MKNVLIVFSVLLALVLLVVGVWVVRYYTAEIRGVITGEEQIESAPSRISRYEHFFALCAAVQSQKAALLAQKQRLSADGMDAREQSRVRSNIAGIESNIARTVAQYNAEASKDYTSARFRASNLPYQLSVEGETRCAQ